MQLLICVREALGYACSNEISKTHFQKIVTTQKQNFPVNKPVKSVSIPVIERSGFVSCFRASKIKPLPRHDFY